MGLKEVIEVLSENKYFLSALVLSILIIFLILLMYYLRRYISRKLKKTGISQKELLRLETPVILLGVVLGAEIVINKILYATGSVASIVSNINMTLVVISISYALMIIGDLSVHAWSAHLKRVRNNDSHEEIIPLFKSVINIFLFIIGLLFVLQAWGVKITGIATSIGVVGVILGFVYKETLSNIFSGISLIMDNSFKKGDRIELSDGEVGYVEEITLRSTKITNSDYGEVIIPNSIIANSKIRNYAHPSKSIRVKILVSIAYGSDIDNFEKIMLNLVNSQSEVMKFPNSRVRFLKMGDYALEFSVDFFIKDFHDLSLMKSKMTKLIYKELEKNKIKIPYLTRTILKGE